MATFSVTFLGCKVSHVDAHAVRERLLADGHTEQEGGGDDAAAEVTRLDSPWACLNFGGRSELRYLGCYRTQSAGQQSHHSDQ